MENVLVPTILEKNGRSVIGADLFSKLLKHREIFICGPLNEQYCTVILGSLMALKLESETAPIKMTISSPGGSIVPCLAILDYIESNRLNVTTTVSGLAASMGAILAINGNNRLIHKRSRMMLHDASASMNGKLGEIESAFNFAKSLKKDLSDIILERTKITRKNIAKYMERDVYLTASECLSLGLVDEII